MATLIKGLTHVSRPANAGPPTALLSVAWQAAGARAECRHDTSANVSAA